MPLILVLFVQQVISNAFFLFLPAFLLSVLGVASSDIVSWSFASTQTLETTTDDGKQTLTRTCQQRIRVV